MPAPNTHQQHQSHHSSSANLASNNNVNGNQFTSNVHVNQFTAQQNRPPRQNTNNLRNTGLSSAGQCGKRNTHGVNGRVLQDSSFQDGDTDFGKYYILISNESN